MALLTVILVSLWLMMTSPSDEEVSVWAWTEDYDMIIVEGSDMEPLYGIQNRHTGVIEIQEPIFANALGYMIDAQESLDAVSGLILEDGSVAINETIKVTYKPTKKGYH